MAVAAPARRTAPAPPPSRTTPPRKKAATPARRAPARQKAATPARHAPARRAARANAATVPAPARRAPARRAPARPAPRRAKPRSRRAAAQPALALAGRTAVAVGQLPDSGLIVRMTRGRAWIGVLGVLLVGIVALNVVTLSFAASSGKVYAEITALEEESRLLGGRDAVLFGNDRIRHEAATAGLTMPTTAEPLVIEAGRDDVATAAARLAAAGGG
jgi:hypothetical protein